MYYERLNHQQKRHNKVIVRSVLKINVSLDSGLCARPVFMEKTETDIKPGELIHSDVVDLLQAPSLVVNILGCLGMT